MGERGGKQEVYLLWKYHFKYVLVANMGLTMETMCVVNPKNVNPVTVNPVTTKK